MDNNVKLIYNNNKLDLNLLRISPIQNLDKKIKYNMKNILSILSYIEKILIDKLKFVFLSPLQKICS